MALVLASEQTDRLILKKQLRKKKPNTSVFGKKVGLVAKLFGCWHDDISRPFVQGETAYRSCLQCGARKQFDAETLETYGAFYFPPIVKIKKF